MRTCPWLENLERDFGASAQRPVRRRGLRRAHVEYVAAVSAAFLGALAGHAFLFASTCRSGAAHERRRERRPSTGAPLGAPSVAASGGAG